MIRKATHLDVDALVPMGPMLMAESPRYRGMEFDGAKVASLLHGVIDADFAAVFVAEANEELVGVTIIAVQDRWFGPGRFVTDLTLFVKPQHRGGSIFRDLVVMIESWAREQGVADLALGVSTLTHAEATVRAYERMGYTVTGYTLTKTLADHGN